MEDSAEKTMPMREDYREKLGKAFSYYLKKEVEGQPPSRVLSVGCSLGYEAEPLLRTFPGATYKGIDVDEKLIEDARRVNDDLKDAEFYVGDARKREIFGEEPWDIVVIRHPQVLGSIMASGDSVGRWHIILENSMRALKQNGLLFVSTMSDVESDMVLGYINSFKEKMIVVVNNENRFPAEIGANGDTFVIVAKKVGEQIK